jgi:hypothetical protein
MVGGQEAEREKEQRSIDKIISSKGNPNEPLPPSCPSFLIAQSAMKSSILATS